MIIIVISSYNLEETFSKDLNFVEGVKKILMLNGKKF
jgi:hypothetical protein